MERNLESLWSSGNRQACSKMSPRSSIIQGVLDGEESVLKVFSPSLPWGREGRGGMGKLWPARLWFYLFFPFSPTPSFQWKKGKFVDCDCHRGNEGPLGKIALKFRIPEQAQ